MENLPIVEYEDHIITMSKKYPVILISGRMGCGKSTQVPLFLLNYYKSKRKRCNIVVTQPRRLAAMSIAKYVARILNCPVGTQVAYQVGMQQLVKKNVELLYCTTGVLLNKLMMSKSLSTYTHIIMDEVHERDTDVDLTLLVIKKLMISCPTIRIILMSSTANLPRLANYFAFRNNNKTESAPVINIVPDNLFPVNIYYLDDLVGDFPELRNHENNVPKFDNTLGMIACELLKFFNTIDLENQNRRSVIIFLPGLFEINEMKKLMNEFKRNNPGCKWWIKILHSRIHTDTQESIFALTPSNCRKVILSTNIAESSITIPDVKYVIDFCLAKEQQYDIVMNVPQLVEVWCSKSNCDQRMGRTGRVMPGEVYRLVTREAYQNFAEQNVPEILKVSLDSLILKTKMFDMGEPRAILESAVDPPDLTNIQTDILKLKEMGALQRTVNGRYTPFDGDLTFLGAVLATLPVDLPLGKFIFLGGIFGILDDAVIIACCLSIGNIFTITNDNDRLKEYDQKICFARGSDNDCVAVLNVFNEWDVRKSSAPLSRQWARQCSINLKSLERADELREDLMKRLSNVGFGMLYNQRIRSRESTPVFLLQVALAGAFYPNYFTYGGMYAGCAVDERDTFKALSAFDPNCTVYLKGMPTNDATVLHTELIKNHFPEITDGMQLYFQNDKVLISFKNLDDSSNFGRGRVVNAVYKILKLKQFKNDKMIIPILPMNVANRMINDLCDDDSTESRSDNRLLAGLPFPWESECFREYCLIDIFINYFNSPSRFWAQAYDLRSEGLLLQIEKEITDRRNLLVPVQRPMFGKVYAICYQSDYCRCRILSFIRRTDSYKVHLIDHGISFSAKINLIFDFDDTLLQRRIDRVPDLAIECYLNKIQPIVDCDNIGGRWSDDAIKLFSSYKNRRVKAKIYSVVDNVMSVDLYREHEDETNLSLTELLIQKGHATLIDECYLSRYDHLTRQKYSEPREIDRFELLSPSGRVKQVYIEPPFIDRCPKQVELNGPFSPLEVTLDSKMRAFQSKTIRICKSSINSVLLHTFPEEQYERMVAASYVSVNEHSGSLGLRDTIKMLDLRGFSSLMYLLFAPAVELRVNNDRTRITGALCGLGYNNRNGNSLFADHDNEIMFDFKLDGQYLERINRVRAYLNYAVRSNEHGGFGNDIELIMQDLLDLIHEYEPEEPYCQSERYRWNQIPKRYLNKPDNKGGAEDANDQIYQLISDVTLNEPIVNLEEIRQNINELEKFGTENEYMGRGTELSCVLCNVHELRSPLDINLHLETNFHQCKQSRFDLNI